MCHMWLYFKDLITLCVVSLAFFIFLAFFLAFVLYQHVVIQNASENARKIKNVSPTRENVSILHHAMGKNVSQLQFFAHFCSRFWLQTLPKRKHSAQCNMGLNIKGYINI